MSAAFERDDSSALAAATPLMTRAQQLAQLEADTAQEITLLRQTAERIQPPLDWLEASIDWDLAK